MVIFCTLCERDRFALYCVLWTLMHEELWDFSSWFYTFFFKVNRLLQKRGFLRTSSKVSLCEEDTVFSTDFGVSRECVSFQIGLSNPQPSADICQVQKIWPRITIIFHHKVILFECTSPRIARGITLWRYFLWGDPWSTLSDQLVLQITLFLMCYFIGISTNTDIYVIGQYHIIGLWIWKYDHLALLSTYAILKKSLYKMLYHNLKAKSNSSIEPARACSRRV